MKTLKHCLKFAMPVIAAMALLFVSCSSKDKAGKPAEIMVPKSAYCVAHANINSLWAKGDLFNIEKLKSYSMLSEALSVMPQLEKFVTNLLKVPSSTGIDTDKDILMFVAKEGDAPMVTFTASLKSKSDFTDFMKTLESYTGINFSTKTTNGTSYASLDKDLLLAYNDKNVVVAYTPSSEGRKLLQKYVASLFSLTESQCMLTDNRFKEYWNGRKEVGFYLPFDKLFSDLIPSKDLQDMKKDLTEEQFRMLKNAAIAYNLTFEDGSIDMQCKTLGISADANNFIGNGISSTLMNFMPDQTLAAASISLNMPGFIKSLEENSEVRRALDEQIEGFPYTIRDILNTFGGNLVASFYGMNHDKPLFAVAADLSNSSLVSEVKDILSNMEVVANNVYELPIPDFPLWLYFDGNSIALTDDIRTAEVYTNGGFSNSLAIVADKASKGNYFYMDLKVHDYPNEILKMIGYRYDPTLEQVLSLLDNIEMVTNKDNSVTFRINLTNKNNSLATLIELVDDLIYNSINNGIYNNYAYYID